MDGRSVQQRQDNDLWRLLDHKSSCIDLSTLCVQSRSGRYRGQTWRHQLEDSTDSRSCYDAGKCAEPHLLRRIKGVSINPNYKQSRKIEENTNDLAVVKLDRPVFRTDTVLPVCLPEPSQIKNLIDPSPK